MGAEQGRSHSQRGAGGLKPPVRSPTPLMQGHNRKNFLRGKVIFSDFFHGVKCLFLVENSILVDPKQILVVLKSEKSKKKKKKKQKKKKKKKKGPHPIL